MSFLHEASIGQDNSWSLCSLEFVATGRVYFDVVLCSACVCNAIHRAIGKWFPSTVVTIIIGLF